jgi:hypothetical protein
MAFCCAVCGEETVSGQLGSQTRDVTEALYVILSKDLMIFLCQLYTINSFVFSALMSKTCMQRAVCQSSKCFP